MNDMTVAQTLPVRMTSKEIAELVEKRHSNVKRTIETLAEKSLISKPQIEFSEEINNLGHTVKREHYVFDADHKRDTYVVVAQLSPEFTARIVDRWQALEAGRAQPAAIPQIELQERTVALVGQTYDLAERCHDSVLRVMLLDKCKNLLSANNDPALPGEASGQFQVYQVLESLGLSEREIRHIGPSAGKRVAAAYRRLTGQEPKTVERIVDGAARQVKVYPASFREDAEAMLSQYLGADAA